MSDRVHYTRTGPQGRGENIMNTQLYLMGGLLEGRVQSDRDLRHLRTARSMRRDARAARRLAHKH
jgi:hypothetical protein